MKIAESEFQAWMGGVQARMESVLARVLPAGGVAPARLHEAMRYATLEGGKRVRPLLAFAAGEVSGAAPERVEIAAARWNDPRLLARARRHAVHGRRRAAARQADRARAVRRSHRAAGRRCAAIARLPAALRAPAGRRPAHAARHGEDAGARGRLARHGGRAADRSRGDGSATGLRSRCRSSSSCISTRPARSFAPPCCSAPRAEISRKRTAGPLRQGDRPALPGGGRRARLRREHGHARQDRRQGLGRASRPMCRRWACRGAAIRRGAARAGARGAGGHRRAGRRLGELVPTSSSCGSSRWRRSRTSCRPTAASR